MSSFRIFKKEIPDRPLYLPSGRRIPFEMVDRDYGFLRTDDAGLISELDKVLGKFGVLEASQSEWEDFEKKKNAGPLGQFLRRERESISAQSIPSLRLSLAGQAGAPSAGRAVNQPQPQPQPRHGRQNVPPIVKADPGDPVAPLEVPISFPKLGKVKP